MPDHPTTTLPAPATTDPGAVVDAFFGAVSTLDPAAFDRVVAPGCVDHGAPPGTPPGPAGYLGTMRFLRAALDLRFHELDRGVTGDKVWLRVRYTGRHQGELFGMPATGREFTFDSMHLYRVADGQVAEHWAVRDDLALLRQLGAVPA